MSLLMDLDNDTAQVIGVVVFPSGQSTATVIVIGERL
jgi:hypothetical protein